MKQLKRTVNLNKLILFKNLKYFCHTLIYYNGSQSVVLEILQVAKITNIILKLGCFMDNYGRKKIRRKKKKVENP